MNDRRVMGQEMGGAEPRRAGRRGAKRPGARGRSVQRLRAGGLTQIAITGLDCKHLVRPRRSPWSKRPGAGARGRPTPELTRTGRIKSLFGLRVKRMTGGRRS